MSAEPIPTSGPSAPHRACSQLMVAGLQDDVLHRLVLGLGGAHDAAPVDPEELGDPFAEQLLARGIFPRTAGEVLAALLVNTPPGDPLRTHLFFLVGEDSQLPHVDGVRVRRNLRFLVTCGGGPEGPDVFLSSFHPDQGVAEVMAWDRRTGGFNFYRTMPDSSAWVFAGNSRHALTEPTRGLGPFESHVNGHILMKELRIPWVHWHSPFARVSASVLREQGLESHPWVARLEPGGAYTLEDDMVRPAISRWTRARIDALRRGTAEETPRRLLEQLLDTLTVNLTSSRTSSAAAVAGAAPSVDLPGMFFVDSALLTAVGLATPPPLDVPSDLYASVLGSFESRLEDGAGFRLDGDTHFAFVVPVRAHEDVETMVQAIAAGLVTRRLVACLLMVDFPNPVFSPRRRRLLDAVPDLPVSDGPTYSQAVADAITNSPGAGAPGSPEAEFAELWNVGEDFVTAFDARLGSYYDAVQARLGDQASVMDYVRLAESRRARVRTMPIAESPLLFATTNVPAAGRHLRSDGTMEED